MSADDNNRYKSFIYRNYEGRNVEYKSSRPWDGIRRERLIKTILSIANAGGGFIVIGYDERAANDSLRRQGIDSQIQSSWETTKVNNYINTYCSPPINLEVIPYIDKDESNKYYIILDIPACTDKPFICQKEKIEDGIVILRKAAIYYRTKNNSCEEISDPSYLDELLGRCLSHRREELLKSFSEILEASYQNKSKIESSMVDPFIEMIRCKDNAEQFSNADNIKNLTYVEIIAVPEKSRAIDVNEAKNALRESSKDYRGWPYIFFLDGSRVPPQYRDNMIYAVQNEQFFECLEFDYWAFYYETDIFYSRNLSVFSRLNKPKYFSIVDEGKIMGEVIISIGRLYYNLGISLNTNILGAVRYSPTTEMTAVTSGPFNRLLSPPYSDYQLTYKITRPLSDYLNKSATLASEITSSLLSKLGPWNVFGKESFISDIESHLKMPKN
jgi:hypothetical protein